MKKRFSMRNKLLIIFGLLIAAAAITEGLLAVRTARKAVTEKIETHLIDKAADTAEIIDGRITAFFQFLEGLTRTPQIRDSTISFRDKTVYLTNEAKAHPILQELYIVDTEGVQHHPDGSTIEYKTDVWFTETMKGKKYTAEPYCDKTKNNQMFITFSLPVYDDNKNIVGVLGADIDGLWLTDQIDDIVVGKTGYAFILGATGNAVAHKNFDFVVNKFNGMETGKKDKTFESVAKLHATAIYSTEPSVVLYSYKTTVSIASYAKMKSSGWTIIISAPVSEFMGTVDDLRNQLFIIGLIILISALAVTFFLLAVW